MKLVGFAHRFLSISLTESQKYFLRNSLHIKVFRNSISLWRFSKVYYNLSESDKAEVQLVFSRVKLRSGNSDVIEIPFEVNLNPEICELYGLLSGDGTLLRICRFYNTNRELVKRFDELLYKNFKIKTRQDKKINSHYVPKVVQVILESLLGKKGYSKNATVPPVMFNLKKEFVKAYIQGLFDTDGCSSHEPPKLTSSSLKLLKDVKLLLIDVFGIETRIRRNRKNDYDLIMGAGNKYSVFFNTLKFYEDIGFNHPKKKMLLEKKIVNRNLYKTLCLVRNGVDSSSGIRDHLGISWTVAIRNLNRLEEFGLLNRKKTNDGNKHIWHANDFRRKI